MKRFRGEMHGNMKAFIAAFKQSGRGSFDEREYERWPLPQFINSFHNDLLMYFVGSMLQVDAHDRFSTVHNSALGQPARPPSPSTDEEGALRDTSDSDVGRSTAVVLHPTASSISGKEKSCSRKRKANVSDYAVALLEVKRKKAQALADISLQMASLVNAIREQ
jgi:hypothetical protein